MRSSICLYRLPILTLLVSITLASRKPVYTTQRVCPFIEYTYVERLIADKTQNVTDDGYREFLTDVTMADHPFWIANLTPEISISSSKQRHPYDITLVSQTSLTRLPALELQCKTWPGTVAVAIYIPMINGSVVTRKAGVTEQHSLPDVLSILQRLHLQLEEQGCVLDLTAWSEDITNASSAFHSYPVNAMRNKAQAMARTEMLLYVDGDFVPGGAGQLEQVLMSPKQYNQLRERLSSEHAGIVFPALQTKFKTPIEEQLQHAKDAAFAASKQVVWDKFWNAQLMPFQLWNHNLTDYDMWLDADDFYEVQYQLIGNEGVSPNDYEPYLLVLKADLPAWDERFRGYYHNKEAYTYALWGLGMRFIVHPNAWVVHIPHPSDLQKENYSGPLARLERHLYITHQPYRIRDGIFKPYVADMAACHVDMLHSQ